MQSFLRFIPLLLSARYSLATNDWISPSGPVTIQFGTPYNLKWGNLSPGNISLDLIYNIEEHGNFGDNTNDTAQELLYNSPNNGSCAFVPSKELESFYGTGRYWFSMAALVSGVGTNESPFIYMASAGSGQSSSSTNSADPVVNSQPAVTSSAGESHSVGGALMPSASYGSSTASSTSKSTGTSTSPAAVTLQISTVASAPAFTSGVQVTQTSLDSHSAVVIVTQMKITTIAAVTPATLTLTRTAPAYTVQDGASTSNSKSSSSTVLSVPAKIGIGAGAGTFGLAVIALCLWLALRKRFNSHSSFRGRNLPSNEPLPERMEENHHAYDGQVWQPGMPPQDPKQGEMVQHKESNSQVDAPQSYPSDPSLPRHATFDVSSNKSWYRDGSQAGRKTIHLEERHVTSQVGTSRSLPSAMSSPRVHSEYGLGSGSQSQGHQSGLAITEHAASMHNRTAHVSLPSELASPQMLSEADGVAIFRAGLATRDFVEG